MVNYCGLLPRQIRVRILVPVLGSNIWYNRTMPYKDPKKQKEAQARYYQDNKDRYAERNQIKRSAIRQYLMDWKESTPCADCGERFPYYVMDFDHRDPSEKSFNISNWSNTTGSLETLKKEISKCDVVCANCHRHRTWSQRTMRGSGGSSTTGS